MKPNQIYYIVESDLDYHYIVKHNVLRWRISKNPDENGLIYLQFIMKGNEKVGWYVSLEEATRFRRSLPHPDVVRASTPPNVNYGRPELPGTA